MCGVAGSFNFKTDRSQSASSIESSLRDIRHRGPDGLRFDVDREFTSGMTRLALVDLDSPCGPLRSTSGRFSIVFNGEIYNYRELRRDVLKDRYQFTTETDTETILALYEVGEIEPEKFLKGMFAYAIFDHHDRRLTLVRDRLGKKPLFYAETPDGFAFASEIKQLLRFEGVRLSPNLHSISSFLTYGYTPGPATAFNEVHSVPSGCRLIADRSGLRIARYWQLEPRPESEKKPISHESALDQIQSRLEDSVRARMIADVPVGMFLSGGIDSSLVLALAQKLGHRWPIKAFTVGFESETEDETSTAREIAKHFGVQHESVSLTPDIFKSIFSRAVYCSDNLLANPAMFANYQLSLVAGRQIKAALNGGGGDELFYGYPTYRADYLRAQLPSGFARALGAMAPLSGLLPTGHSGIGLQYQARKFLEGLSLEPGRSHYWWRSIFGDDEKNDLLPNTPVFDSFEPYQAVYQKYSRADIYEQYALGDLEVWWRDMGLYQADAMSMANSLELRVPMMDHEFVEFAVDLPRELKFSPRRTKPLLRALGYRVLPPSILELKKKGFHVPLNEWFFGPLAEFVREQLSAMRVNRVPFLNARKVDEIVNRHLAKKEDGSYKIIALMVLVEWYHLFFLGEREKFQ